jgi:hypothetical protein
MGTRTHRWALLTSALLLSTFSLDAQVFVVGEKTATSDIAAGFKKTDVPLPTDKLSERGRRELVRNLEAEQGFAHMALPLGGGLTLVANGNMSPSFDEYRHMIFSKGMSAAAGDRVVVTALTFKNNCIIIDFNGGPFAKHRFLSHIQINDNPISAPQPQATGARVTLVFEGFVPEVSAPEVKALLEPLIDFGVKSSEQAYADTLPPRLREAIAAHEVLVGMNRRMVLAALGAPESKMREQQSGDANGGQYEEWIYGHSPQTIKFVRFVGDRVTVVEIAALGKPVEIHDKNELGDARDPADTREVAYGDTKNTDENAKPAPPPSLRMPGEPVPSNGQGAVQFPDDNKNSSDGKNKDQKKANAAPIPPPPGMDNGNTPPASSPTAPITAPASQQSPAGRTPPSLSRP